MDFKIDHEKEEMASRLRGSLYEFTRFFTKYITNRDYIQSQPVGRESHQITICRELSSMTRLEYPDENLLINVEPGSGKSLHICMWVAWCYAINPQCNFIYISYSQTLAAEQTAFIKLIMSSEMYGHLFGVFLSKDTKAKDHFATTAGGHVAAFGSEGAVTGRNAGLPGQEHFSGAVIIDDAHKPDEAHSDTLREKVIKNYEETIRQRPRGHNVPIIFVGQRVHEADLAAFFIEDKDTKKWRKVILKALDDAGNALYPEVHSREYLLELQAKSPYVYAAQFDQNPNPAGGGLFRPEWFLEIDKDPEFLCTFITIDSAETQKTYNDPSAMSFFGLYEIEVFGKKTGQLALHWIDCIEEWIDAKDLEERVLDFIRECSRHKTPPLIAAIEKKSTGVTLIGSLNKIQGIRIMDVKRTVASGSKTSRYIEMQPYVASKHVTFTFGARHVALCKKHMGKITANNTHRHDDICFVAGTKVATLFGYKNIEDLTIKDWVITPFGLGAIIKVGKTGEFETVERFGLEGTHNHPIYANNQFVPLDSLYDDVKIDKLSFYGLFQWRYLKLLRLMTLNIDSLARKDIILVSQLPIREEKILKDCTWQFGNFITKKQYLQALLFTTRMATILITISTIWSVFLLSNICRNIGKQKLITAFLNPILRILKKSDLLHPSGTEAPREKIGIVKMPKNPMIRYLSSATRYALSAVKNLFIENQERLLKHAVLTAIPRNIDPGLVASLQTASYVETNLLQKTNIPNQEIEKLVPAFAQEIIKKEVYNLTVENYGVYYANNILCSNCDTLYDGIKIGLIDKLLHKKDIKGSPADDVMNIISQNMRRQQTLRMNRDGLR